jgi:hypothetical protein|tara:strand:- start:26 stop:253 length:228 start_codon:yes stop_codon:yes gene_type:complete
MAVPHTPIAANFDKTFDIKVNLFPEFSLDHTFTVNNLSEAINLIFGKSVRLNLSIDTSLSQNLMTQSGANAIDIL